MRLGKKTEKHEEMSTGLHWGQMMARYLAKHWEMSTGMPWAQMKATH